MKSAIYTRVSTEDQTLQPQLIELTQFANDKGWPIVAQFSDVLSGSRSAKMRPGLDAMLTAARQHQFECILAVKIDRIARSIIQFSAITEELLKLEIALVITSQGIDTSKANPAGRFQQNILAACAEFERDLIRERVKAGMRAARARGVVLGHVSALMPALADRKAIVTAWRTETGGKDYDRLAVMLGGVTRSTAWRQAKLTG